jgi:hypothetical protein
MHYADRRMLLDDPAEDGLISFSSHQLHPASSARSMSQIH